MQKMLLSLCQLGLAATEFLHSWPHPRTVSHVHMSSYYCGPSWYNTCQAHMLLNILLLVVGCSGTHLIQVTAADPVFAEVAQFKLYVAPHLGSSYWHRHLAK